MKLKPFFLVSLGIAVLCYALTATGPLFLIPMTAWIAMFVVGLIRFRWRGLWVLTTAPLVFYWVLVWYAMSHCDIKLGPCM
jgi:hypothetical protein